MEEEDNDGAVGVDHGDKEAAAAAAGVDDSDDNDDDDNDEEDYLPYLIRYCMYALPLDLQQLQYQQQPREKRKMLRYYHHLYGSHWTQHNSSHPTYYTDMTSSQMLVTLLSSVPI